MMTWQMCLFIFLSISCSDGQIFTGSTIEKIKGSVMKLEKDFNISQPDVAEGGSVFKHVLDSSQWAQASEKNILLAQVISMYLKMLKNITKPRNAEHIKDIVAALEDYEIKYSSSLKRANDLIQLAKIPMNDLKIQRKAVFELYQVLLEVNKGENQRKRRSRRNNPRGQTRCRPNPSG